MIDLFDLRGTHYFFRRARKCGSENLTQKARQIMDPNRRVQRQRGLRCGRMPLPATRNEDPMNEPARPKGLLPAIAIGICALAVGIWAGLQVNTPVTTPATSFNAVTVLPTPPRIVLGSSPSPEP